ncbi:Inosine/uridine-preferring nucleoside hydrolase domain-containing protein [Mycena epipterygia]|nr:Inosine/uridine-preferring nucleoside hydrolase domain-containing protein [Mycena epipterygia]
MMQAVTALLALTTAIILDNDWISTGFIPFLLTLDAGWDVLGLVGDTGNTWALEASLHGLAALEVGNLSSCIPVYKGSDYPLTLTPELLHSWEDLHGDLAWQGAFAPDNATAEALGSDPTSGDPSRVVKAAFIEGFPNGGVALTNVAFAIRLYPKFVSLAKGLVIMGGYLDVNLLTTSGSVLQASVNSDPILRSQDPYTKLFHEYYGTALPFWDETAMFSVLDPFNMVNSTSFYLDVDTAYMSPFYGNIIGYQEALKPRLQPLQKVDYVYEIDGDKLKSTIKRALQYPKTC